MGELQSKSIVSRNKFTVETAGFFFNLLSYSANVNLPQLLNSNQYSRRLKKACHSFAVLAAYVILLHLNKEFYLDDLKTCDKTSIMMNTDFYYKMASFAHDWIIEIIEMKQQGYWKCG